MSENEDRQETNPRIASSTGDPPIRRKKEDRLNRARFAEALAGQIASAPGSGGVVFALLGPYGSGKTSILNMVEETLKETSEDSVVLWFNPWLFSGTDQLVEHFFEELTAQLLEEPDDRLRRIGEALERYGTLLGPLRYVPGVGRYAEGAEKATRILGGLFKGREEKLVSVRTRRRELEKALNGLDGRIAIFIDDLDRLSRKDEIQDVVRLVRLNADLPNVVFVMAFDRWRVEEALAGVEGDGRAYLEKIVQVVHDIPAIREVDLSRVLVEEINQIIGQAPTGPFDEHEFWNVFHTIIRPLFQNVRDVRRYTDALPMTLQVIGDEVRLTDVLALEAIRLQAPDSFAKLPAAAETLTTTSAGSGMGKRSDDAKAEIEEFEEAGDEHVQAIREARRHLFPASSWMENTHYGGEWLMTWSKERRVAHPRVLRFYLEKNLPEDVMPASAVQDLFESLGDRDALAMRLAAIDPRMLEHAVERLREYEDDYRPEHVESAVEVLLNQMPRLREGTEQFMDVGAHRKVRWAVLDFLRKIEDPEALALKVKMVMPRVDNLSARLDLATMVGHREGIGRGLVSEEEAHNLEEHVLTALEHADPDSLARERDLVRLLIGAREIDRTRGETLSSRLAEKDFVFLAVLRSSLKESHSFTQGEVVSRVEHELMWDAMCDLFGEDVVKRRVEELVRARDGGTVSLDERTSLALDTARRYVGGWRPDW
jgi:predicted KAP-like P-loop ATPase